MDSKQKSRLIEAADGRSGDDSVAARCGDFTVQILRSTGEIQDFRNHWQKWPTLPYSDIDFFLTAMEAREGAVAPFVIALSRHGVPEAMVVAHVEDSLLPFKISNLLLFRAKLRILSVACGGLIGERGADIANAAVKVLTGSLRSGIADALRLPQIRSDSDFFRLLRENASALCWDHSLEFRTHWTMRVPEKVADIYSGFSSEHRKKLRWQSRQFEKQFPDRLEFKCFQDLIELERMISDVESVSRKTYQRSLGACFIDNAAMRARVSLEAKNGWLRMYVLYVKGEPVAYWWGVLYHGTFYSEAMGFNPEYRKFSPGTYLLCKTLENLHERGVKEVDFGAGDFHYKQQFGTTSWQETMVFNVFAPRLRPIALNMANTVIANLRFFARRFLEQMRLLERIRRFSRRLLTAQH